MNRIPRRVFLRWLLAASAAVPATGLATVATSSASWQMPSEVRAAMGRIGLRYLAQSQDDATAQSAISLPRSLSALVALIRADYRENRVVLLDGWVLSLTECRIAAQIATAL